ncbi:nucleotide exchange factor GrpE [Candidatus Peregrinibacteria bacterium]|nr:nucleotide exchange factor GrpE [Candidatus Peregrinibacteria bacterium]
MSAKKDDSAKQQTNQEETLEDKLKKAQEQADQSAAQSGENSDDTAKLQEELTNMTEMARRAMADLQNLKRRHEDERGQIVTMANSRLIADILPILDNLQRAKQHIPAEITEMESIKEWLKGLEISINQLEQVLISAGIKQIETVGQKFNPDSHEAVAQDKGEKDTIIEEFEKGYTLSGRVLRHAKVKVGNGE